MALPRLSLSLLGALAQRPDSLDSSNPEQIVPKHLLWAKALFWVLGAELWTNPNSSPPGADIQHGPQTSTPSLQWKWDEGKAGGHGDRERRAFSREWSWGCSEGAGERSHRARWEAGPMGGNRALTKLPASKAASCWPTCCCTVAVLFRLVLSPDARQETCGAWTIPDSLHDIWGSSTHGAAIPWGPSGSARCPC